MGKEKQDKNIAHRRAFLNEPFMTSTSSNISYYIKLTSWHNELQDKPDVYNDARIEFSMSDCHKNIFLDFSINTKEDMRNSLHKLDTIIDVCTSMKEDIKIARKEIIKGQLVLKELENNKKE